jgi:hypothetical protein
MKTLITIATCLLAFSTCLLAFIFLQNQSIISPFFLKNLGDLIGDLTLYQKFLVAISIIVLGYVLYLNTLFDDNKRNKKDTQ